MDLNDYRKMIDETDDRLFELFLKRMEISEAIGKYKLANGLPVENLKREAEILEKRGAQAGEMAAYAKDFFGFLFKESKKLQSSNMEKAKKKPVLVVMAAGMGSRYGGLKQMDPLGPNGELIIDFSLYDAMKAGFDTAICIIKHEIEDDFKAIMNRGAAKKMNILYAYQDINDIPEGVEIPEGRVKPWGTGHAILAARDLIDGPFAVINSDDYYGPGVFKTMFDYLSNAQDGDVYQYCMAGYKIENTLSENGSVSRGVCVTDAQGNLVRIDERKNVGYFEGEPAFSLDGGETWTKLSVGTPVSMNLFGFTASIMKELRERFPAELEKIIAENPLKGEFYIPIVTSELVNECKAHVKVLPSDDKWFGVTYREDRELVVKAMQDKKTAGLYPENLWD